jgi:hypothetical protein
MSWERRGNGSYYYRCHKVNGRSVKEYFGNGPTAHRAAAEDRQKREARQKAAQEPETRRAAEEAAKEITKSIRIVTEAAFHAAGFHQHSRGAWRRRHVKKAVSQ